MDQTSVVTSIPQLQDDYCDIKDDARYQNFIVFYKKINEKNRMLIEKKIIKPVRIFKGKINHMDRGNDGNNGGQGNCSRYLFRGKGRGNKSGGRGCGRGIQGDKGLGGRGVHERGGYVRNKRKNPHVEHIASQKIST